MAKKKSKAKKPLTSGQKKKAAASRKLMQMPLLEFKMPEPIFEGMVQTEYIKDFDADALKPGKKFVDSVRRWGVMESLILIAPKNSADPQGYEVVEGRRRKLAADEAGLVSVPARVFQFKDRHDVRAALTLMLNTQRSKNPIAEFNAIMRLLKKDGMTEKDISIVTGIPLGTVRKRAQLAKLSQEVIEAIQRGDVTVGVAERMAKLPKALQRKLEQILRETGRITSKDIKEVRQVQASDEAGAHSEMFEESGELTNPPGVERASRLEKVLRDLMRFGLSSDEARLLSVGVNGKKMTDPNDEDGRKLHEQFDNLKKTEEDARALLKAIEAGEI